MRETACGRPRLHTRLPEIFRVSRGRNRPLSSPRGTRSLLVRTVRLQDPRKQKRQRPLRNAIRSPALHLRLRNAESSLRALRERTSRQPCSPLRRSPPRSSRRRSRLAQFCGRRARPEPRRESPAAPRTLFELAFPLQDYVLSASFYPAGAHAALSRPLLADAGHALSASTAGVAPGIFIHEFRFPPSSKKDPLGPLVEDRFLRQASSTASNTAGN